MAESIRDALKKFLPHPWIPPVPEDVAEERQTMRRERDDLIRRLEDRPSRPRTPWTGEERRRPRRRSE